MRYAAPPEGALVAAPLDAVLAVYHRPSGATHLLVEPAPQILAALADGPADLPTLLARLAAGHDLADADPAALAERLDELVEAGLVAAA